MGTPTLDRLLTSIEKDDKETAKLIAKKFANESLAMHDLYRDWLTASLSHVATTQGQDAFEQAMKAGVEATWLPTVKTLSKKSLKHAIRMYISGLRGHHQPLKITEDSEKVTIKLKPCGSGGRLVIEGKYDSKPFRHINGKSSLTWNRDSLPAYCTHDAIMEQVDIDTNGSPFVVIEPAVEIGQQPCFMHIYKNPERIPESFFSRNYRKKPTRVSRSEDGKIN